MRLLLDECGPALWVQTLRAAGHDVVYVLEARPGIQDPEVIAFAASLDRLLVTLDRGIGERVVRENLVVPGVIMLTLGPPNPSALFAGAVEAFAGDDADFRGRLTLWRDGRVRSRPIAGG